MTHVHQHVQECIDRRAPVLGIGRVRGDPGGAQCEAQRSFAAGCEPVIGRLAVDEPAAFPRQGVRIRCPRAHASHFLIHDEQQPNPVHPLGAEPLGGGDLRRHDPLGVAGAAAVQDPIRDSRRRMRRYGVEVGGEHDPRWPIRRGKHIGSPRRGVEQLHVVPQVREVRCHEPCDLSLFARHRGDIYQITGQRDEVGHGAPVAAAASRSAGQR